MTVKLLCLLLILFPLFADAIIITKVQIEGERSDDCYIKLYNPHDEKRALEGYNIRKKTSTGTESSVRVIPSDKIIEKNGYLVWASSRNKDFPGKVNADIVSTQYLSRNNSITVLDNEGRVLDSLGWGDGKDQYKKGEVFPLNPEKGQVIKRKEINGEYQNTGSNADDFYLYPPPTSPLKIKEVYTEEEEPEEKSAFLVAISSSVFLGLLILFLKKIEKWQGTVTSKT